VFKVQATLIIVKQFLLKNPLVAGIYAAGFKIASDPAE